MSIELDPLLLLTAAQKKQIGEAVFKKAMKAVEEISEVSSRKRLQDLFEGEIEALFDNGDIYDHLDARKIAGRISTLALSALGVSPTPKKTKGK